MHANQSEDYHDTKLYRHCMLEVNTKKTRALRNYLHTSVLMKSSSLSVLQKISHIELFKGFQSTTTTKEHQ